MYLSGMGCMLLDAETARIVALGFRAWQVGEGPMSRCISGRIFANVICAYTGALRYV